LLIGGKNWIVSKGSLSFSSLKTATISTILLGHVKKRRINVRQEVGQKGRKIRDLWAAHSKMTADSILERVEQKPFRPFALETIGGTWVEVDRKADLLLYDRNKPIRLVVFDPNGRMYIFEPDQISAIEVR
jgi:hypothetical protein